MMHYRKYSSEHKLDTAEQLSFWQQVTQANLVLSNGVSIAYAKIQHPDNRRAIIISNGRVETYLKYKELMFDLYQQGYSIYTLDHQGQGLSDRLTDNPHQGYINQFSDYVNDLDTFITEVVQPAEHNELFLVGHSMGCAIGTLLIAKRPKLFCAAVFSAPMFGIQLPLSTPTIRWLATKLDSTQHPITNDSTSKISSNYVLGGTGYKPDSFRGNKLTHSRFRYDHFRTMFQQTPQAQLGAPTNHWLIEAIDASEACIELAKQSTTPILILQAEKDKVVCNKAQNKSLSKTCHKVVIEGAYHEVFIEQDKMRNIALDYTIEFMLQHSKIVVS